MNNDQFRRLVLANAAPAPGAKKNASSAPADGQTSTGSLGSRERTSIPMTPRPVASAQSVFARQIAERNQAAHPQKKFKTSAPKGVKLASGYVDRARERQDDSTDDKSKRLEALEKSLRAGEIDREVYDKQRFEIAGGSLESTHLVKGLDFKLLERIRRGEDVYGTKKQNATESDQQGDDDVDDAFDELERGEVQAIERETVKKKGQLSTAPVPSGKKRTRDQILAELKASREAAKSQQVSSLGSKFRRIGTKPKPGTRIERDGKGREVLIIVDEDGHEKRKVRKLKPQDGEDGPANDLLMPDPKAKPLGMEVPEQYRQKAEPDDLDGDDIFSDAGDDYDPLAGMDASDSESGQDSDREQERSGRPATSEAAGEETNPEATTMPPPPKPTTARNYFQDSKTGLMSAETAQGPSVADPAIMAAIKRAAALRRPVEGGDGSDDGDGGGEERRGSEEAMQERRRKLERMRERDDADMDLGFGTSRLEDEEDLDDQRVKLSVWGEGGGGEGWAGRGGQSKRKRGPKKRKGDANSAADVLRVMEQRKRS